MGTPPQVPLACRLKYRYTEQAEQYLGDGRLAVILHRQEYKSHLSSHRFNRLAHKPLLQLSEIETLKNTMKTQIFAKQIVLPLDNERRVEQICN